MTFTRPLDHIAVNGLYKAVERRNRKYRVLLDILLETGYRVTDALSVRLSDIECGKLTLREGKTGKERTVSLSDDLLRRLRAYARHERIAPHEPLVPGRDRRKPLTRVQAYRVLSELGRECGVALSPHALRKTYAVRLYRQTKSLHAVRDALLHESLGTTAAYVLE